jgi:hypothetical protein
MGGVAVGVTVGAGPVVLVAVGRSTVEEGVGEPVLQAESINVASRTSFRERRAWIVI